MSCRRVPRLSLLILSILFLLPATEARAQFGAVGVKAGVGSTSLNGGTPTDGGSGFIGGIFAAGQSGSTVAQFEILYSRRSFTESTGSRARVTENFIQIPALFGFRGGAGTVHAMLYAGPSLSIKTTCNATAGALELSCRDAGLEEKGSLWSFIAGMAIDFQMGRTVFFFDGRYDNGLTTAFENRNGKWRSWVLMAGFGYLMPT